jgi:predicted O-methyltransferase YrrM
MYSALQFGLKYLHYWCTSSHGRGHGIHSPFVFNFVTQVLADRGAYYCYAPIEQARLAFRQHGSTIEVEDFGAGSHTRAKRTRRIADIAATALKPKKYGQLLFRMVNHYHYTQVLEMGTSLGITTSYLALAGSKVQVITIEGAPAIAAFAEKYFRAAGLPNVQQLVGRFDDILPQALAIMPRPQLVYIDGNHRYAPTMQYFRSLLPAMQDGSMLVFDDIYWSREMEIAWREIQAHPAVTLTIDLFFLGIVCFNGAIKEPQHFKIRF